MSWLWIWLNSLSVPLQDSKVRRMGWLRVNVRTRGSSGSESGHSLGVGLERFFWVWMNLCRACEDKRVEEDMDGFNLLAIGFGLHIWREGYGFKMPLEIADCGFSVVQTSKLCLQLVEMKEKKIRGEF